MTVVQECGVQRLHAVHHLRMAVFLGSSQVFLVTKQLIGIHDGLVHTSVLVTQHVLHVAFRQFRHHVHTPVTQFLVHLLRQFAVGIEVGISQTCQHLVLTIERYPTTILLIRADVVGIHGRPYLGDRLTSDEALHTSRVTFVGILTVLHDLQAVVKFVLQLRSQRLLSLIVTQGCIRESQRCEVVTTHMSFERPAGVAPVTEGRMFRSPVVVLVFRVSSFCQTRLTHKWRHQTVCVVLQQGSRVSNQCRTEWSVRQHHLLQVKMLWIKLTLCP